VDRRAADYTTDIDEALIRRTADEMAAGGYRDAGYSYVAIDDGWTAPSRDPVTNDLVADPVRFPSGIKALADYVHGKGLLLGIYADVGSLTCGGYVGLNMSADLADKQYVKDVATLAAWGIDALKVDGCYEDPASMNITYPALSRAINQTGFVFSFTPHSFSKSQPLTQPRFSRASLAAARSGSRARGRATWEAAAADLRRCRRSSTTSCATVATLGEISTTCTTTLTRFTILLAPTVSALDLTQNRP
jgi:hypothetical protein